MESLKTAGALVMFKMHWLGLLKNRFPKHIFFAMSGHSECVYSVLNIFFLSFKTKVGTKAYRMKPIFTLEFTMQ